MPFARKESKKGNVNKDNRDQQWPHIISVWITTHWSIREGYKYPKEEKDGRDNVEDYRSGD